MVGQAWFRKKGSVNVPVAEQTWAEEGKMRSEGWGQGLTVKNVDSVLGAVAASPGLYGWWQSWALKLRSPSSEPEFALPQRPLASYRS